MTWLTKNSGLSPIFLQYVTYHAILLEIAFNQFYIIQFLCYVHSVKICKYATVSKVCFLEVQIHHICMEDHLSNSHFLWMNNNSYSSWGFSAHQILELWKLTYLDKWNYAMSSIHSKLHYSSWNHKQNQTLLSIWFLQEVYQCHSICLYSYFLWCPLTSWLRIFCLLW